MLEHQTPSSFRAGAARVDITPRPGIQLSGDIGRRRPAEFVLDPLYARALVVESGETRLCIVSLDLTAAAVAWVAEIRRQAAERFGLPPEAIMVHCVQCHSAPMLGHYFGVSPYVPDSLSWMRGGDDRYNPFAVERILQAIGTAISNLQPVSLAYASGIEGRVAYNRRFVMRDGKVRTHPRAGDPHIRYAEGPIDPEVGVVCFTAEDLSIPAMLLSFTCHPTHGYPHRYVSADWPGAWADEMNRICGERCVPLVINGCCGNVHHGNHLDPTWVDDYRRMGRMLAETAEQALRKELTAQPDPVLAYRTVDVPVPFREIRPDEVERAQALLAVHPEPIWQDAEHVVGDWGWVFAVTLLDLYARRQREPVHHCEVQVFRLGDIAIVGLPGEPFVEGQLRIKLESPTYPTYAVHECASEPGYIPTRQAIPRGGYEAEWAELAPEALDTLADCAGKVLRELF